jgi:hypothetical protein
VTEDIILAAGLGLIFGAVFFIVDIYNENKTMEINTSLIAGITITYFFIILLPEIQTGLEEANLSIFQYIGVLIGFSTIHITEKFILLRVESKSQIKLKEIYEQEANVIEKEKKIEKTLIDKLVVENPYDFSVENLVERLYALNEIRTIKNLWVEEEKKLRKKMLEAEFNKISYMVLLSAIRVISKIQILCLNEEKKLEYSIQDGLQEKYRENPAFKKLSDKLQSIKKIRSKEIRNVEKKKNMVDILIKSLMADRRDKIPKEEFTEKLLELDKTREMLARYINDEFEMEKVIYEDTRGNPSKKKANKNLYALEVCRKITEACIADEKKLEKKLMEVGQKKLSILNRLSELKEISKIQLKCVEEQRRLEIKMLNNSQDIISKKQLTEKFISLTSVSEAEEMTLLNKRSLEKSLIHKLVNKDGFNNLTIKEFNESLSDLEMMLKVQGEFVKKEKDLGKDLSLTISKVEREKFTLQQLATKLNSYCIQEVELEKQDIILKTKIQNHINEHLDELHLISNFGYHLLIGVILFELLLHNLITGIMFFVFALFKALTSKTSNDIVLFPGIEVHEESSEPLYLKIFLALAALIGVLAGVVISLIFHVSMEIIFLLFSFISGVILYTIIREVLPENESGRPLYFLLGIILFLVIIIIVTSFSTIFTPHH